MNARHLTLAATVASAALLGACAAGPRGGYANASPAPASVPVYANAPQYAQYGQVSRIDVVPVAARTSGGGAVLGAVLGAVVGNQIGAGTGRAVATGVGAIGGAVAGNAIERRTKHEDELYRVSVRFDDGSNREFDFQRIDALQIGDRVKFENGQLYRL